MAHDRVEAILAEAGPVELLPGADEALERALRAAVEETLAASGGRSEL